MRYEWNEAKRRTNLRKHGLDFPDAPPVFEGATVTVLDDRRAYGEERFITLGLLQTTVVVISHTENVDVIRVISMRKATRHEEESYFEEIAN